MPQISGITDAMNAPMDESATSTSLMISSSTPALEPPASRALRVRKSNTKSSCSNSRSSSSSSSRPPIPNAGGSSHRGPDATPAGSQSASPRTLSANDRRSVNYQSATQNVMYDQRSLHQHVSVGMDPSIAASAIAHAQVVESQASQMISQVQQQAGQYVQPIERGASQHVTGVEVQAHKAVAEAGHHAKEVEPRASELLAQMQSSHQRELQLVANQAT